MNNQFQNQQPNQRIRSPDSDMMDSEENKIEEKMRDVNINININDDLSSSISELTTSFRKTHIDLTSIQCVICKSKTHNVVQRNCKDKCRYVCHEACLDKWIRYKNRDAFCVMCNGLYPNSEINRAFGGGTIFFPYLHTSDKN